MNYSRVLNEASGLLNEGILLTIEISLLALLIGFFIGLFACLFGLSKSPVLRAISGIYVWIIRGTPMLVQAFIVYFGFPQLIKALGASIVIPADGWQWWIMSVTSLKAAFTAFKLNSFTAGVITLSLNAGAYMSEIFRGGITAVHKGQIEAARSLGLGRGSTMISVVLPQAFKISIPSLVNQFIITVKDTSILSVIGLAEIVNKAKVYVGSSYEFFSTYSVVAIYYLIVISVLMLLSKFVEKKFNYEKKSNS